MGYGPIKENIMNTSFKGIAIGTGVVFLGLALVSPILIPVATFTAGCCITAVACFLISLALP
jgi:hypothetical protein